MHIPLSRDYKQQVVILLQKHTSSKKNKLQITVKEGQDKSMH